MAGLYAVTAVTKEVSHWDPAEGASVERWATMAEPVSIVSETFSGLLKKLSSRYGIDLDGYLFIPDDDGEEVDRFSWNQVETEDGSPPSDSELSEWEAGRLKLYLCDYGFTVEYRETRGLTLDEIHSAGVKTN